MIFCFEKTKYAENLNNPDFGKQKGGVPKEKIFAGWKIVSEEYIGTNGASTSLKIPLEHKLSPIVNFFCKLNFMHTPALADNFYLCMGAIAIFDPIQMVSFMYKLWLSKE